MSISKTKLVNDILLNPAIKKEVDIWVVARLLGHKDIQQIIKTYGHVLQEVIDKEYEID
ncbi:integrase [Streptococcus intermedius]|uniref:Integrase n=1 Tax=Streptococcus intermedius TaxID=1338 RepID=A0AAD1FJD2_STRIT|nr:integrase [Streptococcus intermedius]